MINQQTKKDRISKQRKGQIIDAALSVFSRKGYGEATIPDIAQEAGVAVGTIYNYYQSKRELLFAVIKNFIITEPFLELFNNADKADFPTFISSVLEDRMDFINEEGKMRLLFLVSEVPRDPELKEIYNTHIIKPIMNKMENFYEDKANSGYFRPLNAPVVTRALGGMIIGLLILSLLEGKSSPLRQMNRRKLSTELTDLILNGLQSKVS